MLQVLPNPRPSPWSRCARCGIRPETLAQPDLLLLQELLAAPHLFHLLIQELQPLLEPLPLVYGALLSLADPRHLLLERVLTALLCLCATRRALPILLLQAILIRESVALLCRQPLLILQVRAVPVALTVQAAQPIAVARQQAILILQPVLILGTNPVAIAIAVTRQIVIHHAAHRTALGAHAAHCSTAGSATRAVTATARRRAGDRHAPEQQRSENQ